MNLLPLLLLATGAAGPRVTVEATPLAPELRALLAPELPPGALVDRGGALIVRVVRDGAVLRLVVRERGRMVVRRSITTKDGERPALRVAALVVVEAHRRLGDRTPRAPPLTHTATTATSSASDVIEPEDAASGVGGPPSNARAPTSGVADTRTSGAPGATGLVAPGEARASNTTPDAATTFGGAAPRAAVNPTRPDTADPAAGSADVASGGAAGRGDTPADVPPPGVAGDAVSSDAAASTTPRDPRATTATAEPGPAALRWSIEGGAAVSWWARPGTPQLGLTLGVRRRIGPVALGVRAGLSGLCCALAASEGGETRVEGAPLQGWGGVEVAVPVVSWGVVAVAPVAALGLGVDRVSSTATAFVGDPVEETYTVVGLLARVGVELGAPLTERLAVSAAIGVLGRSPRLVSRLPEPFAAEQADLDAGPVVPWAELTLRLRVF